jgi:hypothetical protein
MLKLHRPSLPPIVLGQEGRWSLDERDRSSTPYRDCPTVNRVESRYDRF